MLTEFCIQCCQGELFCKRLCRWSCFQTWLSHHHRADGALRKRTFQTCYIFLILTHLNCFPRGCLLAVLPAPSMELSSFQIIWIFFFFPKWPSFWKQVITKERLQAYISKNNLGFVWLFCLLGWLCFVLFCFSKKIRWKKTPTLSCK